MHHSSTAQHSTAAHRRRQVCQTFGRITCHMAMLHAQAHSTATHRAQTSVSDLQQYIQCPTCSGWACIYCGFLEAVLGVTVACCCMLCANCCMLFVFMLYAVELLCAVCSPGPVFTACCLLCAVCCCRLLCAHQAVASCRASVRTLHVSRIIVAQCALIMLTKKLCHGLYGHVAVPCGSQTVDTA
jgi:hypothetical protein